MKLSKKIKLCLLSLSLFFTTGFFGGEDPEDAVAEIIQALESNDATLFNARIPKPYWEVVANVRGKTDRNNPFVLEMRNDKDFERALMNTTRAIRSQSEEEQKALFYPIMQEFISKRVASGKLANLSREASLGILPFAPEILEALEYGEEGSGDLVGIVPAEFTLKDGQKSYLAFGEVEGKWYLLGQGDNNKAAMDMAAKKRQFVLSELQKITKRAEAEKLYNEEFYPQVATMHNSVKNQNYRAAAKIFVKHLAVYLIYHNDPNFYIAEVHTNSSLDSDKLWQEVQKVIETNEKAISSFRGEIDNVAMSIEAGSILNPEHAIYFELGETLWQEGDMCLVKYTGFNKDKPFTEEEKAELKKKWKNFQHIPGQVIRHVLFYKTDGIWTHVANTEFTENPKLTRYRGYPIKNIASMRNFTPEEFLLAYAKRYPAVDTKAQAPTGKQEEWKKSLLRDINTLNEAARKPDVDTFILHYDILMIGSDSGNLERDTETYIKKKKDFANTLERMRNAPSRNDEPNIDIESIEILQLTENSATIHLFNEFYYATRKDLNSPWRLVRKSRTEKELERPANWEEDFAKRVKLLEEQQAN